MIAVLLLWLLSLPFSAVLSLLLALHWKNENILEAVNSTAYTLDQRVQRVAEMAEYKFYIVRNFVDLLASDSRIAAAFKGGANIAECNSYLKRIGATLSLHRAFLLDKEGACIASSDAGQPQNLLGVNFADREYFTQAMGLEIERKYLRVNLKNLRQKLEENGARCLGAHFESNWVFDTAAGELAAEGRLLRLRSQEWREKTRHLLTLKLPSAAQGSFKVREERETEVADGAVLRGILEGLGYIVAARYEKVREPWLMNLVEVELDVLPFAEVVELEGRAEDITTVQRRLDLDNAEISTKSYHAANSVEQAGPRPGWQR